MLFIDRSTGRLRAGWRLAIQYWVYWEFIQIFKLLVAAWLLAGSGAPVVQGSFAISLASGVAGVVGAVSTVWLAGRFLDRRPFSAFGFRLGAGWWLNLTFGMALGALLITAVFLLELGLGWVQVTGSFMTYGSGGLFVLSILFPAATFLCVGISEETIFRGYQLKNAAEGLDHPALGHRSAVLLAWVLSSAFFAYLHADNPNATTLSTLNIFLAGLMLGFGYVLSGELAIPIGLHVTWNFFQGAVYGFPVSGLGSFGATFLATTQTGPNLWTGGSFGPEGGLLAPAVMVPGIVLIALWTRLRTGKVAIDPLIAEAPSSARTDTHHDQPKR